MRTRFVAAVGPAVLAVGFAVAVTQLVGEAGPASGDGPDAGRPAAAPETTTASGDAQAVQQGAAAAAYANATAQAEIQRYWQIMDDARRAEAARQGSRSGSGSGSGSFRLGLGRERLRRSAGVHQGVRVARQLRLREQRWHLPRRVPV